jgi:hypothetical protein
MVAATTEMWEEDPALICHWDNCTDGCCPGDLLLSRITHPQLSPEMVIRMFPEMLKLTDCRTHKTVISETA